MGHEKILIIEDEVGIVEVLTTILEANGYNVLVAKDGQQGVMMAKSHNPDIVLLDLGLPRVDGIDVLKAIRVWSRKAILVISARDQEIQKVQALDLGADDYITKPFGSDELLARIRTALRHQKKQESFSVEEKPVYVIGKLTIDLEERTLKIEGRQIKLTPIEFKIICLLAQNPGRVLTHSKIMQEVWGPYMTEDNKILRVNMANIRRKIEENPAEPKYLITEVGIGYRLAID